MPSFHRHALGCMSSALQSLSRQWGYILIKTQPAIVGSRPGWDNSWQTVRPRMLKVVAKVNTGAGIIEGRDVLPSHVHDWKVEETKVTLVCESAFSMTNWTEQMVKEILNTLWAKPRSYLSLYSHLLRYNRQSVWFSELISPAKEFPSLLQGPLIFPENILVLHVPIVFSSRDIAGHMLHITSPAPSYSDLWPTIQAAHKPSHPSVVSSMKPCMWD